MGYIIEDKSDGDKGAWFGTMREAMDKLQIFSVYRSQRIGGLVICEECDGFYEAAITPAQLKALGEELIALSEEEAK